MRILQVSIPEETTPPAMYGGVQWVVYWLTEALTALGHEVHLVAPEGSHATRATLHTVPQGTLEEALARRALEVALEVGPDIIHDHNNSHFLHLARPDLPVVGTQHNKKMFRGVPMVYPSRAEAKRLGPGPVVPHGMLLDGYDYDPDGSDELLFMGALHPRKQVHHVLHAAHRLGLPLCVAGPVRHEAYFRDEVEPWLKPPVRWIGEVGGEAKVRAYQQAKALVLPSKWESFGLVLIEAMACGTPVIAWDNGPAREIVERGVTGWVYRWQCGLRRAMRRVGEIERAACRRRVEEHYTAERMARGYLEVYERLLVARR